MSSRTVHCDAGYEARASIIWWHDAKDLVLDMCQHHSDRHAHALVASGWVLLPEPATSTPTEALA